MGESQQQIRYWIAGIGMIVMAGVLLVVLVSTVAASSVQAAQGISANTNAPTSNQTLIISPILSAPFRGLSHVAESFKFPRAHSATGLLATAVTAPGAVAHGMASAGRSISGGVLAIARLPATASHSIGSNGIVGSILRPGSGAQTPEIVPVAVAFVAAKASASASAESLPAPSSVAAQWPIHGAITTLFGAPDWPYEAVHTGIDISDGQRAGITPIHPFMPGRILQVIHGGGLGNHVIVDHGNGMTSVYGHMASTNVQVGQSVNEADVLGWEGSTGASTGTHLHFEIRINNSPVNPMLYIPGRP